MAVQTPLLSVADFLDQLDRLQLRDDVNWRAIVEAVPAPFPDAAQLARHLVHAGWLTGYQANQLMRGRGQDLRLGGYVLLDKLGEGGMGAVFSARHLLMRRTVALKLIRDELLAHPSARLRFLREVELLGRLSHPHIVTAHDAEQSEGRLFLVMEFCEGASLANLVHKRGPLSIGMACACAQQTALGLQHALEQGLVHRDIKPGNLLVTATGLKVLDLGLARLGQTSGNGAPALTEAGMFLGTPDYVAPEQARNPLTADIRSDLYSLGCTLYFSLTGQVPFPGGTAMEKAFRHQSEEPAPLQHLRPDVPREVDAIVRRLMAKQPGERFQTPQAAADALRVWAKWTPDPLGASTVPQPIPSTVAVPLWDTAGQAGFSPTAVAAGPPTTRIVGETPRPSSSRWNRVRILLCGIGLVGVIVALVIFVSSRFAPSLSEDFGPGRARAVVAVDPPEKWRMVKELSQLAHVNRLAFSPDGRMLAVSFWPAGGQYSRHIRIWDVSQDREVVTLDQEWPAVGAVVFSPDGKTLASSVGDFNKDLGGEVFLWDTKTWKERDRFQGGSGGVLALAFSEDSKLLAVGDWTGGVSLWDVSSGKAGKTQDLLGHKKSVNAIVFMPDGLTLATASADRAVRLWDIAKKTSRPLKPDRLSGGPIALTISRDKQTLACATYGPEPLAEGDQFGAILQWDVNSEKLKRPPIDFGLRIQCLDFTPDGKYLIAGHMNGCGIWNAQSGELVRQLEEARNYVMGLAISPNGELLAVGMEEEDVVHLWRMR